MGISMQVFALGGHAQTITLSKKNVPLQEVFREINRQTGLDFIYEMKMMKTAHPINIHVKNESVDKVLDICFDLQPFYYTRVGNSIILKEIPSTEDVVSAEPPAAVPVTGKVTDSQGAPLQNVSVTVVGSQGGTTTNSEGRFSINPPDNKNIVLEFSSVGYQTRKVKIGNQTEVNVVLELDVAGLSDVVIVGYGTQKKINLTGAVDVIGNRDLTGRQAPTVS
ncbi:MAG: carboxypeptidase-like regulatory domain-containing protein, partial [Chitinophagaceae bacterium]|nr:carboxypeptidase-like regulatory domain-containing protein [Chitinophagaceae bacterium]